MGKIEEVHGILHSLTKAEKRGIRMAFRSQAASKHFQLMDCLLEMPSIEEERLKEKLDKLQIQSQLPTHLHRLRKTLVKFLIPNVNEQSIEGQLQLTLGEVNFLFHKRLLSQIPSVIRKGKKKARAYSKFLILLKLIDWERTLLLERPPKDQNKAYEELRQEERELLDALQLKRDAADLQLRMRSLARKILRPSLPKDVACFEAIVQEPVLQKAMEAGDFITRVFGKHTYGLYCIAMLLYEPAYQTYTDLMEEWKHHADWINEQADLFLANFNNYQISFLYSQKNNVPLPAIYTEFFSRHQFGQPKARLRFQQINYSNSLVRNLNTARFSEGEELATELAGWLSLVVEELPPSTWLTFQYNLAIFHFLGGDASKANRNIQEILNFDDHQQRRDIKDFAQLFELVLQFELGNVELVEYRWRALERNLSEAQQIPPLTQVVLDFFKPDSGWIEEEKFQALQDALDAIETATIGLQELKLWAASKCSERSITTIFREKLQGN